MIQKKLQRFLLEVIYRAWKQILIHLEVLALQRLVVMKRSHILKQNCNFRLQVCLDMYEVLVNTRRLRVNVKILYGSLVTKGFMEDQSTNTNILKIYPFNA